MNNKLLAILLMFLMLFQACHEELVLESISNKKLIVVEGFITNNPGPYKVKISYSSQTDKPEYIPISDCIVTLFDNTGYSEELIEESPGIYSTALGGIHGVVGNAYGISISTITGEKYKTDLQEMIEPVEIDSVYAELIRKDDFNYQYGLPGYQFYIDTKTASTRDNYFLWTMVETYEYDISYKLVYIIDRYTDIIYSTPMYDTLETCWNTETVKSIFTGKMTNLNIPKIQYKPLHFVGTETKKLSKMYSLLINQYVIGEDAFYYWQNIENQISNENFLTTSQPFNIRGNIKNINDEEEMVLGYFTVAPIVQKRVFFNRPGAPFLYPRCAILTDQAIGGYMRSHPPLYFFVEIEEHVYGLVFPGCIDCRSEGGELDKPDFWINK